MPQAWVRIAGGLAVFVLIGIVGLGLLGGLEFEAALDTFAVVMVVAIPAGIAAYALIEYAQTRRLDSIRRQFDTRTLVLMPVAMALNIVLGTAVASALKIPIYLDSIGTILVAALAGPLAGAATGFLSNVIWTYLAPAPFGSPFAVPFAVVAVVVGLLAGAFARWGWLRPRRGSSGQRLAIGGAVSIGAVLLMVVLALRAWLAAADGSSLAPESDRTAFLVLGWVAMLLVVGSAIGLVYLLVRWRDLAVAYILAAGVITGIMAALLAAPIAAGLFGGVTGSGADFVIAAFRQAGADLQQAVLGQSLISDPVDKVITYFVVYLILGAMAARTKARFPQGEYLLPIEDDEDDDESPAGPSPTTDPWRALDPLTRLVAAVATMVAALVLGGLVCPLVLLMVAVAIPAALARELTRVARLGFLLSLPLVVSVIAVNVLFSPGTVAEGAWLAAEVVVRVLTMAGATVLFYRTTSPADLVGSLQHHGLSPRMTFVVHNAVAMIPRLAERAREVTAAQRARGMDSESSWWRRGRGVVALAVPTVLGAVGEVETRTLALETRGFSRPGRPTVLRVPRDGAAQRLARWAMALALVALVVARVAGVLPC